jgi:hypothetical protein
MLEIWVEGDRSVRWKWGVKSTHNLQSREGEIGQRGERKWRRKINSLSIEWMRRDKSGDQETTNERRALANYQAQTEGQVRTPIKSEGTRGTHGLSSEMEVQVKTTREGKRAREIHSLSCTDRGPHQDTKTKRESEWYSLPIEYKWRDKSGHQHKARKRAVLTSYRV